MFEKSNTIVRPRGALSVERLQTALSAWFFEHGMARVEILTRAELLAQINTGPRLFVVASSYRPESFETPAKADKLIETAPAFIVGTHVMGADLKLDRAASNDLVDLVTCNGYRMEKVYDWLIALKPMNQ